MAQFLENGQAVPNQHPSGVNTLQQTFGCCKRCKKRSIKTIHIPCGHLHCCNTCKRSCQRCPIGGCNRLVAGHLKIYSGFFDENSPDVLLPQADPNIEEQNDGLVNEDNNEMSAEASDSELLVAAVNNDSTADSAAIVRMMPGDELYDRNAKHTPGNCIICYEKGIEWFCVNCDNDIYQCGHGLCTDCYKPKDDIIKRCPLCDRSVQMVIKWTNQENK